MATLPITDRSTEGSHSDIRPQNVSGYGYDLFLVLGGRCGRLRGPNSLLAR